MGGGKKGNSANSGAMAQALRRAMRKTRDSQVAGHTPGQEKAQTQGGEAREESSTGQSSEVGIRLKEKTAGLAKDAGHAREKMPGSGRMVRKQSSRTPSRQKALSNLGESAMALALQQARAKKVGTTCGHSPSSPHEGNSSVRDPITPRQVQESAAVDAGRDENVTTQVSPPTVPKKTQILKASSRRGKEHDVPVKYGKTPAQNKSAKAKKQKRKAAKRNQPDSLKKRGGARGANPKSSVPKKKRTVSKIPRQRLLGSSKSRSASRQKAKTSQKKLAIASLEWNSETVLGKIFGEQVEGFPFAGAQSGWGGYQDDPDGALDLVIGVDFGTTFTKVVISDPGSKRSWAVPLSTNSKNPYLINSDVFLDGGVYRLSPEGQRIARLKIPFLSDAPSTENYNHAVAFLALVIRFAKQWFLNEKSGFLRGQVPFWFVNVGLPAKDFSKAQLVKRYRGLVWAALYLSTDSNSVLDQGRVISACGHAGDAIRGNVPALDDAQGVSIHRDQVHVVPEIMAQLYGFLRSRHWDKNKPEFMLVDIGGGTIDSTVFNVVEEKENHELTFAIFSARVESMGTINLHQKRVDWILEQVKGVGELPQFVEDLQQVSASTSIFWMVPNRIEDYLRGGRFGARTFDQDFLEKMKRVFLADQLKYVLTKVNPNFRNDGRDYPVILAGGGSANALYQKLLDSKMRIGGVGIEELRLPRPDNLEAPGLTQRDYHRVSVAYGLSFENLGKVLTPQKIAALHIKPNKSLKTKNNNYVSKDMT